MKKHTLIIFLFLFSCAKATNYSPMDQEGAPKRFADDSAITGTTDAEPAALENSESHNPIIWTLLYLPNRVVDLLDIVRLRARVGPGVAVDIRATKPVGVFVGTYLSAFAGLPGPRLRHTPKLPVGVETLHGARFSLLDASSGLAHGPEYSPTEFGVGLHFLLIGLDVGLVPVEALDFITGIVGVDIRDDEF